MPLNQRQVCVPPSDSAFCPQEAWAEREGRLPGEISLYPSVEAGIT